LPALHRLHGGYEEVPQGAAQAVIDAARKAREAEVALAR